MPFKKEERYWNTRIHEDTGRRTFMNSLGEETSKSFTFGHEWSNGEPGRFTLHQAVKRRNRGNDEIGPWMPSERPECLWKTHLITPDYTYNF